MYEIIMGNPAQGFIRGLDKTERIKILDKIGELETNPRLGKKLKGRLAGLRSLRIGKYRAIYRISDIELLILILTVGYRAGDVYHERPE